MRTAYENDWRITEELLMKLILKSADYVFSDRLPVKELGHLNNLNVLTVVNIGSSQRSCSRPKGKVIIASA